MSALLPNFIHTLDAKITGISTDNYSRLSKNLWWDKVAVRRNSESRMERINWLLSTAMIERPNASHGGGQAIFEDIVGLYTEFENENATAGLTLKKETILDTYNGIPGGEAMNIAAKWASDVGKVAAYWPQKCIAEAIRSNPVTYDGKTFFAANHDQNPFDSEAGTYANDFTGSASGIYPGAVPIGGGDLAVAQNNLAKAVAYVTSIKQPNGQLPRNLAVRGILVPPALYTRAVQLTSAFFLSGASSGPNDTKDLIAALGLGAPILAPELGSNYEGGSDTTYYLVAEEITGDELGAFAYVDREPFNMITHDGVSDAELARKREFQWILEGRNTVAPGHPYLLFRCQAT